MIPAVIYTKQPVYVSLLYDGGAVGLYLFMLSYLTGSKGFAPLDFLPLAPKTFDFRRNAPAVLLFLSLYARVKSNGASHRLISFILGNTKSISYRTVDMDGIYGEWVSVNRAHMKKYVILHCHGGGYSTGSSLSI